MKLKKAIFTLIMGYAVAFTVSGQPKKMILTIKANKTGVPVQPTMWGVFFEDINMGADGGIYAELVKNRSFEFYKPLMGWTVQQKSFREGAVLILNRQEDNKNNPRFLRISASHASKGELGITNEGFRGISLKKGGYSFSTMFRQSSSGIKMHIELVDEKDNIIGSAVLLPTESGEDWKKITTKIHS